MINLTSKAVKQIKDILPEDTYLRVGISSGGCSGFSYVLQVEDIDTIDKTQDTQYNIQEIPVVIDRKSALYLDGVTLDYKDDELMGQGFLFDNPNSQRSCGCGKSFQV